MRRNDVPISIAASWEIKQDSCEHFRSSRIAAERIVSVLTFTTARDRTKMVQTGMRFTHPHYPHRTMHSLTQLALWSLFCSGFVFLAPIVLALEFLDATGRIDKLLLAGEKWM